MQCKCGSKVRVIEVRKVRGGLRRRRLCDGCGDNYRTFEIRENEGTTVSIRKAVKRLMG